MTGVPSPSVTDAAQALLDAIDEMPSRPPGEIIEVFAPRLAAWIERKDAATTALRAALAATGDEPPTRDELLAQIDERRNDPEFMGRIRASIDRNRLADGDVPPSDQPTACRCGHAFYAHVPDADGHCTQCSCREVRAAAVAPQTDQVPPHDLDSLGRYIAQALADTGLDVGTYGVCADLIHVTTPDGRLYDVTLDEPTGIGDESTDLPSGGGCGGRDLT